MSKQKEIAVFREIKVGEYVLRFWPSDNGWMCGITPEMMQALQEPQEKYIYGTPLLDAMTGKANEALDKMAENARELGLDYEPVWDNLPSNKDVEDAMRLKRLSRLAEQPAQQQEPVVRCMEHGECFGGECIYTSPPAQQEPVAMQVRPSEFAKIIKGKEKVTGIPAYWAEWPSKEQP